ncbi:MAG: IS1595 family transposase, partial [Chloroflexota bacterium]|nr:IS1595 family transposase [Chloroflexota bacterium]
LHGIVEADETYIGGKPRGKKVPGQRRKSKRTPVIGAIERGGKVKAAPAPRVTTKLINYFLRSNVDPRSVLVTDYWPGYNEVRDWMQHVRINHSKEYVRGDVYTNTIEGFWALVKRAISGQHHHYTVEHAGMYIDEAAYKYNTRKAEMPWDDFMLRACGVS